MKMRRLIIALGLSLSLFAVAQTSSGKGDELMKQAQAQLEQKEFTPARFLYKQAFSAFATSGDMQKAIECGIKVSTLYHRESLYKEAFDMCRAMDQVVANAEQSHHRPMTDLHFKVAAERLQMYIKLKSPSKAKMQLDAMQTLANQSGNLLKDELLYTKMTYFYSFGLNADGDATFKELTAEYRQQKNYSKVSDSYKTLISIAVRANNASLVSRTYQQLITWMDEAKTLTANDELSVMKRKFNASQQTISEKEDDLTAKKRYIAALIGLIAILGLGLAALIVVLIRNFAVIAKQKKVIRIANEHNNLKTKFISNISGQMTPALDAIASSANRLNGAQSMIAQVESLKLFTDHIQHLTVLENSLSEPFEMTDNCNVESLCKELMVEVKSQVNTTEVATTLDVTPSLLQTNTEQLRYVLTHLLQNAVNYTESGKITLAFKKRGIHVCQFVITDTGHGIPAEKREDIFKPFSGIKNLAEGDSLGLPICSLIAIKLNGNLALDETYTKGCRFILTLNI